MKKTSVYLDASEQERLKEIAEREGRSVAEVIRSAIAAYCSSPGRPRTFALAGAFESPPSMKPVSEMSSEEFDELMRGFGEQ